MKISIIVAKAQNNTIGKLNKLLWHLPKDFQYFKKITSGHHIAMGRKTYESIGKPLPNRVSIIISGNQTYHLPKGCLMAHSLQQAIQIAQQNQEQELFIIGGGMIYSEAIQYADRLYITEVHANLQGDTFFPQLSDRWSEISRQKHQADHKHAFDFDFVIYEK